MYVFGMNVPEISMKKGFYTKMYTKINLFNLDTYTAFHSSRLREN
jgi:hypothetical protein